MCRQVCGGGALGLLREEELELLVCGQRHLDFQVWVHEGSYQKSIRSPRLSKTPDMAQDNNCPLLHEEQATVGPRLPATCRRSLGLYANAVVGGGSHIWAWQCADEAAAVPVQALQQAARYEGGFSADHPTVRGFWEVVQALPLVQKRAFLAFATGSDRCRHLFTGAECLGLCDAPFRPTA